MGGTPRGYPTESELQVPPDCVMASLPRNTAISHVGVRGFARILPSKIAREISLSRLLSGGCAPPLTLNATGLESPVRLVRAPRNHV